MMTTTIVALRNWMAAGVLAACLCLAYGTAASAQEWCEEWQWSRDDGSRLCEERTERISAVDRLEIDGRANGGISVRGADVDDIEVVARVQVWSRDGDYDLSELADDIEIQTAGGRIRAEGPRTGRGEGWSVSYVVTVPHRMNLEMSATNGGISVRDVDGQMRFRTTNGGVDLRGVSGDVRGRTTNGGVHVELTGDRWQGSGLEVETTNGGVRVMVPDDYSAEFETGTVNGSIQIDFPITVRGRINRRIETTLGDGGPLVRITTTNGGVVVRRR